ncbi:hypothetical protein CEXT_785661 [Caerostris extrusa]|uniref:Uncharacterized protein n=1 Tax=Caerostris extrusa TaxID=172846 RepID=A0AAV4MJF2_CAEEX|nr:hypothetical protein CEXT_785661 [Caerostris extrusa]
MLFFKLGPTNLTSRKKLQNALGGRGTHESILLSVASRDADAERKVLSHASGEFGALRRDAFSRRRTLIRIIARSQDSKTPRKRETRLFALHLHLEMPPAERSLVRPPPPPHPNAAEDSSETSN